VVALVLGLLVGGCDMFDQNYQLDPTVRGGAAQTGFNAVALLTPGCSSSGIAEQGGTPIAYDAAAPYAATFWYFLTAAHCINTSRGQQQLFFGAQPNRQAGGGIPVESIERHPTADIAVGHLTQPAPYPGVVLSSVDLGVAVAYDIAAGNNELHIVGYGTIDSSTGYGSKREANLRMDGVGSTPNRGDVVVVTDELGTMMCQGDSGGYLGRKAQIGGVNVEAIAGVNSAISNPVCTTPGTSGVAVRVDRYLDFITAEMAKTGKTPVVFNGTTPPPPAPNVPPPGTPPGPSPGTPPPGPSTRPSTGGGCNSATSDVSSNGWYILAVAGLVLVAARRRRRDGVRSL
jgi:MYXO-CTERM domain-containing protein